MNKKLDKKIDRKDQDLEKFAHKNSFDLFKRTKKKYIFEGCMDRSMRTSSWRDKNSSFDLSSEEDKSYTLVKNIKKSQHSDNSQYKNLINKAITSYGIILYTWIRKDKIKELRFLLPQRRDTIHYIEFSKYNCDDRMVPKIISLMTKDEKKRIMNCYNSNRLIDIWFDLWINKRSKTFKKEFKSAIENYKNNIEKYKDLLLDEKLGLDECPWQPPKGRKHVDETELECAKREFEEETTISKDSISICNIKPYNDVYIGSDGKVYRNVFFVAYLPYYKYKQPEYRNSLFRKYITEETQDMKWMTYEQCMTKLSDTQKIIFTELNNYLIYGYSEQHIEKRKSF